MTTGIAMLLWPSSAVANAGLPMIVLYWPGALLLLVPVIALETACFRRYLQVPWSSSLRVAGLANLASTVVGIPLTWLALVLLQIVLLAPFGAISEDVPAWLHPVGVVLSAPWFLPNEATADLQMVGAAAILSVPFFLASVYVERWVAARLHTADIHALSKWSWAGNLLSYCAIEIGLLVTYLTLYFNR